MMVGGKSLLWHRREMWWPTWQGWLALLVLAVAAAALVTLVWVHTVAGFLAMQQPARGAHTLIVEGWMDEPELAEAVGVFRRGGYARLLSTGGPIDAWSDTGHWQNYAARGAAYAIAHGVAPEAVVALPAPPSRQERTWTNALTVRAWAARPGNAIDAVDVFTAGVHARRSRALYARALGEQVEVGVLSSAAGRLEAAHWWRTSAGTKAVIGESVSWLWTSCCFWPARP